MDDNVNTKQSVRERERGRTTRERKRERAREDDEQLIIKNTRERTTNN